jgi:hypothetical protein
MLRSPSGIYDTPIGSNKDVVGTITVICIGTPGVAVRYVIALSPGG